MRQTPHNPISRRRFFLSIAGSVGGAISILVVSGCGQGGKDAATTDAAEPAHCRDLTGVSEQDLALRKKLAYVDESPIPDNQCANCNLFLPPGKDKKCGTCMLFKGPVEAKGYCTYWAPKV